MNQIVLLFFIFNFILLKTLSAEVIFLDKKKVDLSLETYKKNKELRKLPIIDAKNNTALEIAIIEGNVDKIYSLLKKAGNLSFYINTSGKNLYHHLFSSPGQKAIEGFSKTKEIPIEHKRKIAKYISRFDLKLNQKSISGHTPASYAVLNNSLEDLQILKELERGENKLDLQLKINGNNLIHLAALHHSPNVIHFLLKYSGLDINERNSQGKTAIFIAAELFEHTSLRDLLDVKPKDPKLLRAKHYHAFLMENNKFIIALMDKADLYSRDSFNNIFEALIKTKKYSLFEYLLKREMNKNKFKRLINKADHRLAHLVISPGAEFPYYLRDKYQAKDLSFLRLLHSLQFSIDHRLQGESPLSLSILNQRHSISSFLIHNLDLKNLSNSKFFGQTYAMQAVSHNNMEAFKALYDRGVDMSIKVEGSTALHKAVQEKRIHMIDFFSKDSHLLSVTNDKNVSVLEMIKKSRSLLNYFSINTKDGTLNRKDNFPERKSSKSHSRKRSSSKFHELPLFKGRR